jgi:site-specific recombinase XerC
LLGVRPTAVASDYWAVAVIETMTLVTGLAEPWCGYLRDWNRSLRAGNYPATTRYNYLLAATQLARYLGTVTDDAFAGAAVDPTAVQRLHVEDFQTWMIETRSASTALNKHKGLQQFFKWLVDEEEIDRSPMARVRQPKTPKRLVLQPGLDT